MTKYFLVNNASRAAVYGIGTYTRQVAYYIINSLTQYELCFIDIYSDVKEFTVDKDENGVRHYRIPSFQGRNNVFPYYRSILFLLSQYLEEEETMIFHFNYSQHYDLMRLVKAKYKFSRIFYTIHYLNWCFTLNGNLTRFRKLINNDVEDNLRESIQNDYQNDRRLFSLCDEIMALSKFTVDLLRDDYKMNRSKIHLVRNGMKEEPKMVHYNSAEGGCNEILFVGRLDEIKGIEYIIKAFKKISTRRENVHLTFVGDGDFSRYLALCDGVWDQITFTGKLAKEKLEQFYCRATIGVQPSFHEQCSYSAIEMMAHGIPFIATDSTGLGEMMDYTPECKIHIDEDDFQPDEFVEELAGKMELLLSNPQLRERLSQNLRRLFQERYNLICMGNALGNILDAYGQKDNSLSKDFLFYLDNEMIRIVNKRPVLDMDFVGLTGIGCYLWWRIKTLEVQEDKVCVSNSTRLQEYLIYYIDWLSDVIREDGIDAFSPFFEPVPLSWLLKGLKDVGFYKTKVERIIRLVLSSGINLETEKVNGFDNSEIARTALKIYNLNL